MRCKICDFNETDNPDQVCDDCKVFIILNEETPPNKDNFI